MRRRHDHAGVDRPPQSRRSARSLDGRSGREHRVAHRARARGVENAASRRHRGGGRGTGRLDHHVRALDLVRPRTVAKPNQEGDDDAPGFEEKPRDTSARRRVARARVGGADTEMVALAKLLRSRAFTAPNRGTAGGDSIRQLKTDAIAGSPDAQRTVRRPARGRSSARVEHRPCHVGRLFNGRHGQSPGSGSLSLDRIEYSRTNPAGLDDRGAQTKVLSRGGSPQRSPPCRADVCPGARPR